MTYRLRGDIGALSIPPQKSATIGSDLWRHTCFEAFIAIEGEAGYHEFNFAPSGEWAVYECSDYRDGHLIADPRLEPQVLMASSNGTFELKASVRLDLLSHAYARAPLRVAMTAVVEACDGVSYWALHHSHEKPDFHDRSGFTLRLERPAA